eukprot:scaffold4841_cov132-Cylindrotheca_fusiformis.AAC.6
MGQVGILDCWRKGFNTPNGLLLIRIHIQRYVIIAASAEMIKEQTRKQSSKMKLTCNFGHLLVLRWAFVFVMVVVVVSANDADLSKPKPRQLLLTEGQLKDTTLRKIQEKKPLTRREKEEVANAERETYEKWRGQGFDEVGHSKAAQMLRQYKLRNKRKRGILRKQESSLAQVLFPRVSPEEYFVGEEITMYAGLVESKRTQVPFLVFDLPGFYEKRERQGKKKFRMSSNLGSRLQGHNLKPTSFDLVVGKDVPCTPFSLTITIQGKMLRWLRKLIEQQYRVHFQLDGLPVLMRSRELNSAVRGYPVGFKSPGWPRAVSYLYNHLKFTITYHEDPTQFEGLRITGFDVRPVSIAHDMPPSVPDIASCHGFGVENDPSKYLALDVDSKGGVPVVFTYDVRWEKNDLEWTDRWDVYLVGSPDDDIHYYIIVNSLMIVLFMTGAIATIIIRTLRKDIAGHN